VVVHVDFALRDHHVGTKIGVLKYSSGGVDNAWISTLDKPGDLLRFRSLRSRD
jgi:hypothetical protein